MVDVSISTAIAKERKSILKQNKKAKNLDNQGVCEKTK